MVKFVLQAIPSYIMSCFLLPQIIVNLIEGAIRRFWWGAKDGRYMAWLAWKKLCQPKANDGSGFRDLRSFNLVLLANKCGAY